MEDFKETICRLCLNITADKEFEVIGDIIRDLLNTLSLKLTLDETDIMCHACSKKLLAAYDFKSKCIDMEDSILTYINSKSEALINFIDLKDFYLKTKENEQSIKIEEDQKICRLCMQLVSDDFRQLEVDLIHKIHKYIPEVNCNSTKDPVICQECFQSIKIHTNFLEKCSDTEARIKNSSMDKFPNKSAIKVEKVEIKSENGQESLTDMSSNAEPTDELTEINLSPPAKRLKISHFNKTKQLILNIYKSEIRDNPVLPINEIVQMITNKTGASLQTIQRIINEYKTTNALSIHQNRKCIIDLTDSFYRNEIRRKVYQYILRNENATLDKVLNDVNRDPDLPNFRRTTFYKLLKSLNFICKISGKDRMLVDTDEIVLWRREYLKKIRSYRAHNKKIYFLNETCVYVENLKQRAVSPGGESGRRQKLIVCHIGSDNGFVPDALWLFESKTIIGDYHEEIDTLSFEKWFENTLLKLDENCVIVLDNASYHSRTLEEIPTTASHKSEIQDWLHSKNIPFKENLFRLELLEIVRQHEEKYRKYVIDEMAKAQNKAVLRLPPYHCELNPIQFIWADIKNFVADNSKTFEAGDAKDIIHSAIANVTVEKWKECIQHVKQKVEKDMWELDDVMGEPLVVKTY